MALQVQNPPEPARRGWASRWLGLRATPQKPPAAGPAPEGPSVQQFIDELIGDGREVFALLGSAADHVSDDDARRAWSALHKRMALIPFGRVVVDRADGGDELVEVSAFFLDRFAVSNREFSRFVASGCYDTLELWPREVWPSLLQFVDRTGKPGPAGWSGGSYPADRAHHPVTGVCWYEAAAYARWAGKRLTTAAEWQKAGGWPEHLGGGRCTRYPWGDLFDPARANLRPSGRGDTVPVDSFPTGATPNGIFQMTGNVWEWLDDPLDAIPGEVGSQFLPWKPMRRIIGGAFDTYLSSEATCHFVTGQGMLDRRHNIGFRCVVAADRLRDEPSE